MEDMLYRFPHIGRQILSSLNDESLTNCRYVERSWKEVIDYEEYPWKRILKKFPCEDGNTLMHIAAKTGQTEMFKTLFENEEKDKNPVNNRKQTPLHFAARNGNLTISQLIIENVKDKNPKDDYGITPLHMAARNGHLSVCQLIIENVKNKNPKDDYGSTPFQLAKNRGFTSICNLFNAKRQKIRHKTTYLK